LKGISPRLVDLSGKKIGMFCNSKGAARPVNNVVAKKLKEKFPTSDISFYTASETFTTTQMEGKDRARFVEWVNRVDAVIGAIGD
jgi:hypothetical protein